MYTKSNRKSGSAKSLAWFPPYFCFRFWLERLPNAIFRRFSTFRRRLVRVVPWAMLRVPFLGTLGDGVTPPTTPTTPSVEEFFLRLRFGVFTAYLYYVICAPHTGHMAKRKRLGNGTFSHRIDTKFGMTLDWENEDILRLQICDICPPKKFGAPLNFAFALRPTGRKT